MKIRKWIVDQLLLLTGLISFWVKFLIFYIAGTKNAIFKTEKFLQICIIRIQKLLSMKNINNPLNFSLLFLILFFMQGCDLIFGIFEVGVWVGIIFSAIVVFLIIWLIVKVLKGLKR
jgi:hypothetical protein